jgi:nitrile hydratase subunit beta
MNGPHDLGGMMGFGPVAPEANEPVFHAEWERRAFALTLAMGMAGMWNIDRSRFARESMTWQRYLASSYYEIWFEGLIRLLVAHDLASASEIGAGMSVGPGKPVRRPAAREVPAILAKGGPSDRKPQSPARFKAGDRVRARNMHPEGHTRLPRYLRGHAGSIVAIHGAHVFPDARAAGQGEDPQWLYAVAFDAREVWGERARPGDSIRADLWEPYLDAS